MSEKGLLVGTDYAAWLFGAADRAGLVAPPDDYLPRVIDGAKVLGDASPVTLKLLAGVIALDKEAAAAKEAIKASDSKREHDRLAFELQMLVEPGKQFLTELAGLQMRLDLREQIEAEHGEYAYLLVAAGGKVVALESTASVAAYVMTEAMGRKPVEQV